MRTELGLRNSAPIIEGSITILGNGSSNNTDNPGENIQLIGVDMFAEPMFRNQLDNLQNSPDSSTGVGDRLALLQPGSLLLADTTAQRLGLQIDDVITVSANGRIHQLNLINLLVTGDQPIPDNIAMTDIGTAQSILDFHGRLSRIDLVIDNNDSGDRDLSLIHI